MSANGLMKQNLGPNGKENSVGNADNGTRKNTKAKEVQIKWRNKSVLCSINTLPQSRQKEEVVNADD